MLVDGVTKLSKLEGKTDKFNQAENFRKLLLATSVDIRVLLVKLADRLHNMRTIQFLKDENKKRRIANETLEIYAPIAERMGMQEIRSELDELCFKVIDPDARQSIINRLNMLREKDENILNKTIKQLYNLLIKSNIESKVFGREKKPFSIWRKMQIKSVNLSQLSDILAFKIIVKDFHTCYSSLGVLHNKYTFVPGRFKDYISTPKPNGYQSLHTTLIGPLNRRIEIQIKTKEMDEQADFGVAAHWTYKDKVKVKEGKQYRWIRQILDILDQSSDSEEFLEHTKMQMYNDQVFVFTPKGDLISLPKGAMPLDFAFSLHTEIGSRCVGVKINNSIKPLNTLLKNGDQVEVICTTKNNISPTWLGLTITGKAKACINRFIHVSEDKEFIKLGKTILESYFKNENTNFSEKYLLQIIKNFNLQSIDDLYKKIGLGKLDCAEVLIALFPEKKIINQDKKIVVLNKIRKKKNAKNSPILINGFTSGMSIHYSKCCHPIPGDELVGYLMSGKGLMIHVMDCEKIKSTKSDKKKLVNISWGDHVNKKQNFTSKIKVVIKNEVGSLGELTSILGRNKSNIRNLKITERTTMFFKLFIEIDVLNLRHLKALIVSLRASNLIESVERI